MENREISRLKVNPNNPRGEVVVDDSLRELAASIEAHGVLQPILITPNGTIVCGHRRVKACGLAKRETIPVIVSDVSDERQLQIMLIENLQREDLTTLQTAKAYQILIDHGLSITQIAKATGFRSESISRHLDILQLHPELHGCFDGDQCLALGAIPYLLPLPPQEQLRIGNMARGHGWTISRIAREANGERLYATQRMPNGNGNNPPPLDQAEPSLDAVKRIVRQRRTGGGKARSVVEAIFEDEPSFEDYVSARKVVLYEYELMRRSERYGGTLNVASDEMVANIVRKSCAYFQADGNTVEPGAWMSPDLSTQN